MRNFMKIKKKIGKVFVGIQIKLKLLKAGTVMPLAMKINWKKL